MTVRAKGWEMGYIVRTFFVRLPIGKSGITKDEDGMLAQKPSEFTIEASLIDVLQNGALVLRDGTGRVVAAFAEWLECREVQGTEREVPTAVAQQKL